MNNVVRVGIGVMVIKDNQVLLGHRLAKREDTGGIQENDCWSLPGGKQELFETMYEGAGQESGRRASDNTDYFLYEGTRVRRNCCEEVSGSRGQGPDYR